MGDLLALVTILLWPIVPLFWIPVHCLPGIFRRLGLLTFTMPFIIWLPLAVLLYEHRKFVLQFKIHFPFLLSLAGILLLIAGTLLHIWTAKLLRLSGLIGLPEISAGIKGKFVTTGPFSVVRHPTYLAHTLMFAGVYLITGVNAVGIVTVVDFLLINAVIIPLEERELITRFGEDYKRYRNEVPRFFPRLGDH